MRYLYEWPWLAPAMKPSQMPDWGARRHQQVGVAVPPPFHVPMTDTLLGVRCPHGEVRASDAIDLAQVRAELVVQATVHALPEQIDLVVGQRRATLCSLPVRYQCQ